MLDGIRRRWKLLSVIAVVVVLLAVCVGKYWPTEEGPTYTTAGDDLCASLPFEIFEATLGPVVAGPVPDESESAEFVGCHLQLDNSPDIAMSVGVAILDSSSEAQDEYYASRTALSEVGSWDLKTPARRAQWSLGRFDVRGSAYDGNMVVIVYFRLGTMFLDIHFGEPMERFLSAAVEVVRKANRVNV